MKPSSLVTVFAIVSEKYSETLKSCDQTAWERGPEQSHVLSDQWEWNIKQHAHSSFLVDLWSTVFLWNLFHFSVICSVSRWSTLLRPMFESCKDTALDWHCHFDQVFHFVNLCGVSIHFVTSQLFCRVNKNNSSTTLCSRILVFLKPFSFNSYFLIFPGKEISNVAIPWGSAVWSERAYFSRMDINRTTIRRLSMNISAHSLLWISTEQLYEGDGWKYLRIFDAARVFTLGCL